MNKKSIKKAFDDDPVANATLAQMCLSVSEKYKDNTAFSMIIDGKIDRSVTYKQMGYSSAQIASVLTKLGVQKGDRVMLFSENSPEWPLAYFGIAIAGAVSVPLLTGFSNEQIQYLIEHSGVRAVCISRSMAEKIANVEDESVQTDDFLNEKLLPVFSKIPLIYIDSMANSNTEISVSIDGEKKLFPLDTINNLPLPLQDNPNDLASIIYTSGTQGNSKGVMLSSKNIIFSARSSFSFITISPKDKLLSVLPLAHSYECGLGLIAPVICGASIAYLDRPPSPSVLLPALELIRPTVMTSVPLLIEKVYNNGIAPKLLKNKLYKFPLTRSLAIRVAGKKLKKALGGRIRFFGIGGAPLAPDVEKFLYHAKFPYTIGYGLTEAAPLVAGNAPKCFTLKSGIVPPKGVKLRIAKCLTNSESTEGEIQVTGPNIMLGYYNDTEKTAETITTDGWLRTGDLGNFDKKGQLHIRGRLKALILGPSGENIYPEEIERLLGSSQLVEESLVYSGQKGELIALVRLSEAAKSACVVIEHAMEDLRTWVNKKLAAFSKLSRIEIKYEPFEKTPTMKIKRYLYV
ncbi:MAG: AMP-binding protein [Treponema sp.]|nr:AMP-binding protein [Treponema sp.]